MLRLTAFPFAFPMQNSIRNYFNSDSYNNSNTRTISNTNTNSTTNTNNTNNNTITNNKLTHFQSKAFCQGLALTYALMWCGDWRERGLSGRLVGAVEWVSGRSAEQNESPQTERESSWIAVGWSLKNYDHTLFAEIVH